MHFGTGKPKVSESLYITKTFTALSASVMFMKTTHVEISSICDPLDRTYAKTCDYPIYGCTVQFCVVDITNCCRYYYLL